MALLLDTNVLIALADEQHVHHHEANVFFQKACKLGWATCPIVESGFLRIFGHPNYPGGPGSPGQARILLHEYRAEPGHQFWSASLSPCEPSHFPVLPASRHLTDFYLLALSIDHGGTLATFDRRIDPDSLRGGAAAYYVIGEHQE
jgi:uncharacterized protein